jgi:hypothetical protein
MAVSLNDYATKIFSEHPISLYTLDDDVSYISLISNEQRKFESGISYVGWEVTNGVADDDIALPLLPSPFIGGPYAGIAGNVPLADDSLIEWKSPPLFELSELNEELASFAISCYLYQSSIFVNWYEIGYVAGSEEYVTRVEAPDRPAWINFDFTYLPEIYNSDEVKIIIRANVNLNRGDLSGQAQDYQFIVNGLAIGQWSETSSSESLGQTPQKNNIVQSIDTEEQLATGGDDVYEINVDGIEYVVHEFTSVGTSNFNPVTKIMGLEYLIVAGGGAGGKSDSLTRAGGGGGGGGLVTNIGRPTNVFNSSLIVVGSGGNGSLGLGGDGTEVGTVRSGSNSSAFGKTAVGGGGGGNGGAGLGANGGSGGGSGRNQTLFGTKIFEQGNDGAQGGIGGLTNIFGGGGGGGAGTPGSPGTNGVGGNGGVGLLNSITGTPIFYAGGGGGARGAGSPGSGGLGGGGNGTTTNNGADGLNNFGGGGGGAVVGNGGNGGSGIVIIRYPKFSSSKLIPASEYGINNEPGYYVVENNRLLAKNEGTPLVYGSQNVTRIYASEDPDLPSVVLPGKGFLFESDRYARYSVEFWMKIEPNTEQFKRIFGPIDNDYGIYINNGFISLLIGDNFGSHPVSEWYRTMLVQIVLNDADANLIINGETVITIPLDRTSLRLPTENDWVGFYSDPDIKIFELDCVSFYSYPIPVPVAKRRFVYGQGTSSPQAIATSFEGTTSYVDFANAKYTSNIIYPDVANWNAGYKDNLVSTKASIAMPNYSLPLITVIGRDLQELYDANKDTNAQVGETFFTFRPFASSTENLLQDYLFDSNPNAWKKINNTALSSFFDSGIDKNVLRVASFNTWQRVLNDEVQTFDWDHWDDDDWENVYFFESDGFEAGTFLQDRIPISANANYRFSIRTKRVIGNANDPYITIQWFNASTGGTQIGDTLESSPISLDFDTWQEISISGLAPSGATYAKITYYMSRSVVSQGQIQLIDLPQFIPLELNWTEPGYMLFDSLNFVERLTSFYGVFASRDLVSFSPLVVINSVNGFDQFKIILENNTLKYIFNSEVLYEEEIDIETNNGTGSGSGGYEELEEEYLGFAIGMNIKKIAQNYGYSVSKFFESPEYLQMYIAGDTEKTFYDKFYKFGFCNDTNNQQIENSFLENGFVDRFDYEPLVNHFANYTLTPINRFERFFMDISVQAVWEEYFPLSKFAGFVKNSQGETYYDVDMLQFNLGYPPVVEIVQETLQDLRWTYAELFSEYNSPIQKSYSILNTPELSGYEIYADLDFRRITEFFFNTERSSLRAYVTFQVLSDGANQPLEDFPYTRKLAANQVSDANLENSDVQPYRSYLTKFEVIDKTIIYPPKKLNFQDVAMVVHFDIKQEGILSNPLRVRDFEITSRALSQYDFNPIGTEFGSPIYPFVKSGIYYDNKEKNPMLISKKRFPYLYLTKDSGIQLLGNQTLEKEHSASIVINQERIPKYDVGAMQFWMKFDRVEFPSIAYPIFEIEGSEKTIEFVIRTDSSGKRGVVVARDKQSKILEPAIVFYQNGIRVKTLLVEFNQWNSIGIAFNDSVLFDQYAGYITFFRGISFHNVSYFRPSGLGESLATQTRLWSKVFNDNDPNNFSWSTWYVGPDLIITETRTNFAYNPSVEVDLKGWSPTGGGMTVARITSDARFGDASVRCVTSSSNNSGLLFANLSGERLEADPNTEYTVSAYARVPNGFSSKSLRFRIRQYTATSGGSILPVINSNEIFNFSDETGWVRLFFTFTTSSTTNAIGIEISQQTGNVAGQEFYVDGLLLEESTNLFPKVNRYFDGSVAVGGLLALSLVWNGTPHDSSSTTIYYVPAEDQIRQWLGVYVVDQSLTYVLTPKNIYQSYAGTNRFVVDDGQSITFDADAVLNINDVIWNRISGKPA